MLLDRTSQTIAHFIGYFDAVIEEARMRTRPSEGRVLVENDKPDADFEALAPGFASDFNLRGFIPDVPYKPFPLRSLWRQPLPRQPYEPGVQVAAIGDGRSGSAEPAPAFAQDRSARAGTGYLHRGRVLRTRT